LPAGATDLGHAAATGEPAPSRKDQPGHDHADVDVDVERILVPITPGGR